jgi:hypothetical protein
MTIKELNKLIKEELDAFMQEDEMDDSMDTGDDIEVTTDEPDVEDDPLATLRQIYDMLKPIVEPEGEVEDFEGEEEDLEGEEEGEKEVEDEEDEDGVDEGKKDEEEIDENLDHPNYRADYIKDVAYNAEKIKGGLNESFDGADRFKKLANIIK